MIDLREKKFQKLCKVSELSPGNSKRFILDFADVALFNVDGEYYALDNVCPHQHAAIMYDGYFEDDCIVCPAHGWKFNLKTGLKPGGGRGLEKYELEIKDGIIYIEVKSRKVFSGW